MNLELEQIYQSDGKIDIIKLIKIVVDEDIISNS